VGAIRIASTTVDAENEQYADAAFDLFLKGTADEDPSVRKAALNAFVTVTRLIPTKSSAVFAVAKRALSDPDHEVRKGAVFVFESIIAGEKALAKIEGSDYRKKGSLARESFKIIHNTFLEDTSLVVEEAALNASALHLDLAGNRFVKSLVSTYKGFDKSGQTVLAKRTLSVAQRLVCMRKEDLFDPLTEAGQKARKRITKNMPYNKGLQLSK